jgi:WD40 repeat protein
MLSDSEEDIANSLLATLEYHTKSVNIVRWSTDGLYLASGSDDAYINIYIYTPDATVTQVFGSKAAKSNVDNVILNC